MHRMASTPAASGEVGSFTESSRCLWLWPLFGVSAVDIMTLWHCDIVAVDVVAVGLRKRRRREGDSCVVG